MNNNVPPGLNIPDIPPTPPQRDFDSLAQECISWSKGIYQDFVRAYQHREAAILRDTWYRLLAAAQKMTEDGEKNGWPTTPVRHVPDLYS